MKFQPGYVYIHLENELTCALGFPGQYCKENVPWYRGETVVTTVRLLMFGKENRLDFG